ncbi:protein Skeletor, isoforms B/C-like isoform X1 [Panulirus ornatus]|uniref:protein Skeletor, isoforms B/C-like isoform X1 n=1 Tax=Panulirus ornatus TaxID=150431 RepID=UPI003A83AAF4
MGRSYYTVCLCISVATLAATGGEARGYYGSKIGGLETLQHGVRGQVYAIDSRTIHIQGFSYDGNAPDAFFYGGSSSRPGEDGFIIPDEDGGMQPLGRYINKDVTLTLPKGKTLQDVRWISVWCRAFAIDFGHVIVDKNLDYPRPQKIEAFTKLDHGVSSDRIVVVDAQTFLIPSFTYDGTAPDGHFWVGKGSPDNSGTVVPDENGSEEPLKKYLDKTIVITLPGDLTVFDIDYLSVWCRAFLANFGYVSIPKSLNVPPSLKMLGVAPQTKLNCEVLWDALALEVRWAVAGESIVMQLVGRIEDRQYMAFGTSGTSSRSVMVNGDVVIAWLDQTTGRGVAQDYYLTDKAQCQGGRGACPDTKITGNGNNVRLLNAALINNFTMLTFQRPLRAVDHADTTIFTNGSQAVIWAVGPINSQGDPSYHRLRQKGDVLIDFGRIPRWNCPLPEEESGTGQHAPHTGPANPPPVPPTNNAWYIPPVPCHEPDDGVFYAQIGPTGGESGYNAITGHVGWGISWYVNGLLIPEIYVVRGKTYTFVVEGGYDPEHPARYHPFYISDDPEGGYEFKTPAERSRIRVFAGVGQDRDGRPVPTAFGRLCEWSEDPNQSANAFSSFGAYQRTLQLDCQEGQPGILQWTPDSSTPDTVYYQCYTHRFLGWKIHVLDTCDLADGLAVAGSVDTTVVAQGGAAPEHDDGEELSAAASTQVFTSDGRPLSSDTLPTPPQLASARRLTSASIISRPKVGPFRGDHPPPVPAQVPHLAQFSIQRRPLSRRRTTVSLPPLDSRSSQHGPTLSTSGSAPRPVVVAYSQDESRTTGHKVISFTEQPMTTYNSTRLQTTALTNLAATNQTHLTILKDVWAILTRENPDLNSEHPRDDAYPEHDHLAQQERGRREAFSPEGTRSTASSGRALLLHSMFAWSVAIIVALAR